MKLFRLAAVLRLRVQREATLQQQHSELVRRSLEAQAARAALVDERTRHTQGLALLHSAPRFDVGAADRTWRYVGVLDERIQAAAARLAELQREAETARQTLVAASRDRKMLERLKERQEAAERQEAERRDGRAYESVMTARVVWERQRQAIAARGDA